MSHLPSLIHDLALILGAASIAALFCKWLKQPVVLGYLLAGFFVGPQSQIFPSITETASIKIWAEIGVIFLLFGLGLEFSFKKLLRVGGAATVTALVEIFLMLGIGYAIGRIMGWSFMDSLFLGGILCISSTTIIFRAFDELGLRGLKFTNLVFGVLIVEDLVAVVLLVLLSTVSVTQQFHGGDLLFSIAKFAFFLTLWFITGIFLLPTFLRHIEKFLNDELLLVISASLCLAMVFVASSAGFSPALGAFVMGSILAETTKAEKIEHLVKPVRDFFGAVFFVSVGMLLDPTVLKQYWLPIALITLVTIFGKAVGSMIGAVISGQSLKHSTQTGLSLAQIGEFSFIIATLGTTLKVTSSFLYPIAVSVSAITIFTTPFLIRNSASIYGWMEKRLPLNFRKKLLQYEISTQKSSADSHWKKLLSKEIVSTILLFVVVLSMGIIVSRIFLNNTHFVVVNETTTTLFKILVTLVLCAPFLWALSFGMFKNIEVQESWKSRRFRAPILVIGLVRILISIALILFLIGQYTAYRIAFGLGLMAMVVLAVSRWLEPIYLKIASRFMENLSARESLKIEEEEPIPVMTPWDAHMEQILVSPDSLLMGLSLQESRIREQYGVTIAMLDRGNQRKTAPSRDEILFPGDKIYVIGTDEEIQSLRNVIEVHSDEKQNRIDEYSLQKLSLSDRSRLVGKNIRESGLREQVDGLLVGIERGPERILNPDATFELLAGDLLWIVGDRKKIDKLRLD